MKPVCYIFFIWMAAGVMLLSGCPESATGPPEPEFLIRVGETTLSHTEFNRAFDIHKMAYDYDRIDDPATLQEMKRQFLKQMTEQVLLRERARDMGLTISDTELNAAVRSFQAGYPEGEFEKALLESAISFENWKEGVRTRLLIEKVVQADLAEKVSVTSEEIEAAASEGMDPDMVRERLRRQKAEASYAPWVENLQKIYTIEISTADWLTERNDS